MVKAINAALGEDVDAGFEREISAEVRSRSGRKFQGIAVPDQYFTVEQRTLLVGSSAAQLYPETHRGDLFIDRLRASLIVGRFGATVLNDLVGDQDIPRQTASATAQWVAEDGALTETQPTFDDVTLSPKTVGAVTSYSRRTLINAVPAIEEIVRNDLTAVIAEAIDYAGVVRHRHRQHTDGSDPRAGRHQRNADADLGAGFGISRRYSKRQCGRWLARLGHGCRTPSRN